jgi:DNA-3-methyladenine glycosylase II
MPKLTRSFSCELSPPPPFDFGLTVHKPAGWPLFTPFERFEDGALWTATRLEGRLAGVRLVSKGTTSRPRVGVRVFTAKAPSRADAARMKRLLGWTLGAEDDLAGFYAMAAKDRVLRHSIVRLRGMHDTAPVVLFPEACLAILLQMAPLERSNAMMSSFIGRYGEVADFDGKRVRSWPTPARVAKLRASELARACKLGYRAKYVVALARRLEAGFPSPVELAAMPAEESKRRLLELPGIGDYSADIIDPHGGFPIDAWSVEVFAKLFYGRAPAHNRDAVEKVKREGLRRWGRYAWLAFFYTVQDLRGLSRDLGLELRLQ